MHDRLLAQFDVGGPFLKAALVAASISCWAAAFCARASAGSRNRALAAASATRERKARMMVLGRLKKGAPLSLRSTFNFLKAKG
jgi:sulfite reductase beta subunit-like hemoprotein